MSALTTITSTLASCSILQFYPITNGYRLILGANNIGSIQFDFGTSGSINNRMYAIVKDENSNVVFNHYIIMS